MKYYNPLIICNTSGGWCVCMSVGDCARYVYAADDALQNLCSQGNCTGAVTSNDCAVALEVTCADLGNTGATTTAETINACSDCVHWNWDTLQSAGCFNDDAVMYCVGA